VPAEKFCLVPVPVLVPAEKFCLVPVPVLVPGKKFGAAATLPKIDYIINQFKPHF
jgi:hypothetical protein